MNNPETQTNNRQLNLDAMDTKIPLHKVWKKSLKKIPSGLLITSGLMCAMMVFFIIQLAVIYQTRPFQADIIWPVLIIFGITLMVVCASVWRGYSNYKNFIVLNEVAKANNFEVVEKIDNPEQKYAGSLLRAGKNQSVYSVLKGIWARRSFEVFNLMYVAKEGGKSSTNYAGILVVKLPRKLPNVIFDSKSDNFMGISSLGNATPSSSQKIQLEGDFNKYFDVYVPKNYTRDVLYFLTPELMQLLIQEGKDYDIEVIGDELYIYNGMEFDFGNKDEFKGIFKLIESVGGEFSENTESYKDQVSVAQPSSTLTIEPPKLKKKMNNFMLFRILIFLVAFLMVIVSRTFF